MNTHDLSFDTIAAIATPPGKGGIAVVKLSGPESVSIASGIIEPPADPFVAERTVVFCHLTDTVSRIDDALVFVMYDPRSYTGEDVVELQVHGGFAVAETVLQLVISRGARQALPGEFTRRAFLNGKMDLAQAEGVMEIVEADNLLYLKQAERLIDGAFSKHITSLINSLSGALMHLEASIDFPEDTSSDPDKDSLVSLLTGALQDIDGLLETSRTAERVRHGVSVVLAGPVNVGKSSLFNVLLGKTRAIVHESPGTTRDWLEAHIEIDRQPIRLIDTAGLRETSDSVEKAGVAISSQLHEQADIVLLLHDSSSREDHIIFKPADNQVIIPVESKCDISQQSASDTSSICISSVTGEGIPGLRSVIAEHARSLIRGGATDTLVLVDRHRTELLAARTNITQALDRISIDSDEFLSYELREAVVHLESILGKALDFDVLDAIFSNFCIGK